MMDKVNPWWYSAVAHGHPLKGATGAGLMAKMLAGLEATSAASLATQVMCISHAPWRPPPCWERAA